MKIGIDLGGTKIEGVLLDSSGREQIRKRVPTPRGEYVDILAAVASLVRELEATSAADCTVGIATPGSLNRQGLLRNSNTVELNGKPLLADLQETMQRPLRISNDANCFTLSEAHDGAAAGHSNVFGVIIGTGTGGGIVVNGHVLDGSNRIAGEWGHNPLPWPEPSELPGPPCYCGKNGCIETFLSGPALSAHFHELSGQSVSAVDIVLRADRGEDKAERMLQIYERRLAKALASVINVLDPQCIVLGGGLSNVQRLYNHVPAIWGDYIFSDSVNTLLLPPRFGDSSGVRGAAWLWGE